MGDDGRALPASGILERFLFVLKMDSYSDGKEHESGAKRIKLDLSESSCSVLCSRDGFPSFSTSIEGQIDISEGKICKICLVV